MKKLFALMLALCMLCGCCAFAEETTTEFSWSDVEELAASYPGAFMEVGVGNLIMYVPESFYAVEPTDEQKGAGVFFILEDEAGYRIVGTYQSLGEYDLAGFVAELVKAGATDIAEIAVNDIPCMEYDLETADGTKTGNVVYYSQEDNTVLTFSYAPVDNEAFQPISMVVMASVQAGEE